MLSFSLLQHTLSSLDIAFSLLLPLRDLLPSTRFERGEKKKNREGKRSSSLLFCFLSVLRFETLLFYFRNHV
uniref:Uncharacterized protein n=1 Tax=Rhizophora mucronata TaxID=61149 RepID=A0A2P2MV65_RHIMU